MDICLPKGLLKRLIHKRQADVRDALLSASAQAPPDEVLDVVFSYIGHEFYTALGEVRGVRDRP